MKVLVTGGAGFIGSHVADAYLAAGFDVAIVDNLASGRREFVHPRCRFYEVDIRDPALRTVFEQECPEIVNHHAAQASVVFSVSNPHMDADINVMGTINLFSLCREFRVRRIIFASTGGAIYGEPEYIPVDEVHSARPLAPYGIGKLTGETYLQCFGRHGLHWSILRYGNVYGPRQDPHGEAGVVAIFTNAMLSGKTPTIFGDGNQTRDFVYVEDVARANLLATQSEVNGLANIATGVETSVNEIFRHLAAFAGYRAPAAHAPARLGEVYRIALDARHAEQWLGWKASTSLEEGLKRTVEWFRTKGN